MIVYRAAAEPIDPRGVLRALVDHARRLPPRPDQAAATGLFIEAAELESAVADAVFPAVDDISQATDALAAVTAGAARAVVAGWRGADPGGAMLDFRAALSRAEAVTLPPAAERRISEGYAYYALHPEAYALAAQRFARGVRPAAAAAVGLRTIGSGLAAVVVAALQAEGVPARAFSVRPRGHPFDRVVSISEHLAGALRAQPPGTQFLVVDEGPGISGTSFASAAAALEALGIAADRIHLFPSWTPAGSSLQSARARVAWERYRKWHADARDAGVGVPRPGEGAGSEDWSGGAWRRHLFSSEARWPAAMPSHERVKVYRPADRLLVRYAGLGRYGEARRARAEALAAAGFGPPPGGLTEGYLSLPFEAGEPCTASDICAALLQRIAAHTAFLSRAFGSCRSPSLDDLQHMVETNAREADPSIPVPPLAAWGAALGDAPAAAIDARMQPHEWIRTARGFTKTDALDHSADHFFPGAQDPAWDLAAAEAEFSLDPRAAAALVDQYARLAGDRGVGMRLPFYRLAYAAFALGYADFAAQSLRGSPEAARFEARRGVFLARLRAAASAGGRFPSQ